MLMNNNENFEICKRCGGGCCKSYGCFYSPKDFKDLSYEALKELIEKGNISIDSFDIDLNDDEPRLQERQRNYFLRARHVGGQVVDFSYGGVCKMLTDKGCSYSWNERPYGGKKLIPSKNHKCLGGYTKKECALDWLDHIEVLERLAEFFKQKDKEELEKRVNELTQKCIEFSKIEITKDNIQEFNNLNSSCREVTGQLMFTRNMSLLAGLFEVREEILNKILEFKEKQK